MLLLQLPVELLCLLTLRQAPFAQLASVGLYASNLLKARMIITPYNQHVRLLSSEPFGWFAPPKSTRAWEPTLFMESFHSSAFTLFLSVTLASLRPNQSLRGLPRLTGTSLHLQKRDKEEN